MVVARLLTPAEIGVFSITMVMTSLISAMRDLGAGQYLVQEPELTPARIRATWTVMLCMGLLMSLVVLALAYPIAWFYEDARMLPIMSVISLNFVVSPFGSMTYAWLMREMRFEALAVMRLASSFIGAVVSVGLAWADHGPISLAYGNLAATLINACVALYYRPKNFGWMPGIAEIRRVVGFGSKISPTGFAHTIANGVPEMLLGKLHGLAAAGFYSRANGLAMMFQRLVLDAVQAVALPLFAKVRREEGDIGAVVIRATTYATVLGWAFFAAVGLLAYPLIRMLYGTQWDMAVDVTRLMSVGMALGLPAAMFPVALMAVGRSDVYLRASMWTVAAQVLCIGGGSLHSLEGAGVGFVLAKALSTPIWFKCGWQHLSIDGRALLESLLQLLRGSARSCCSDVGRSHVWTSAPYEAPVLVASAILGAVRGIRCSSAMAPAPDLR